MTCLFVLGGARSGKSRYAQDRAEATGGAAMFVATAQAYDGEMADRIARHQADRDARWTTIDAPLALPDAITAHAGAGRVLLIDCLTLWTSNVMLAEQDMDAATEALVAAIHAAPGTLVIVANEVGLGIVPDNALARRFRDCAGRLNQRVAAAADEVVLIAAGLPIKLKG